MTNVPRCVVTLSGVISQGVAYAASFDPVSKLTFGGGQFFDAAEWLDTLMLIGLSAVIYALFIFLVSRCLGLEKPRRDE
jgi:hypothetical protein